MTDILSPQLNASTPPPSIDTISNGIATNSETKPHRQRDEIFWTELEIRRIGNLVAECIHARRYIGDTAEADEERQQMRTYIDAMKRKAMRVLHRAELYASSGHSAWPGIDATITDPVSLAEEYVRVVQNYEAVLMEEESRAKLLKQETEAARGEASQSDVPDDDGDRDEENWEAADHVAFKEAVRKEQELKAVAGMERNKLFGEGDGIRRRKVEAGSASGSDSKKYSEEDEELMARHQPIQDELTSNLVDLVGQLKESISANGEKMAKDNKVLDETEDALENNLSSISKQGANLKAYSRSASISWWVMLIAVIVVIIVFIMVGFLLTIPM